MMFSSVLSITLVPVLMTVFIRGRRLKPESANPMNRFFTWLYAPLLRLALRWKWMALVVNFAVVPLTVPLLFTIGSEFMPPLFEGSMLYMPTAPPGLSVGEATRLLQVQDKLLRQFPEVERVFGTVGRATTSTDNTPMGMVNTTVTLKPKDEWRPGLTTEALQSEMDAALQFPGFPNVWTQPIRNRLDMLLTGIKTPVGIKIFGADLAVIQRIGEDIERILQDVPGTRSVYAERVNQGYFTDIEVDRHAIARHGLTIEAVQDVIQSALGGGRTSHEPSRGESATRSTSATPGRSARICRRSSGSWSARRWGRRSPSDSWSGRPGSLLTLAPHRSGRAGSAASGSSTDGFATRRRVPAGPGSQAMATAIPKACLASSAIRCRDVETGPNLGVLAVFPSTGATCRCPLPSTGSRGLNSPASAVL